MNSVIKRATMKMLKIALHKQDVNKLADKGNYILSLCVNLETSDDYAPIEHHLPLRDQSKSEQDANNWNLTDSEIRTVKAYQKELVAYANIVIASYNEQCSEMIEVLPLWIVFPTYSATTMGWRMGIGEKYEIVYLKMLERMRTQELKTYKSRYPAPEYMKIRSGYNDYDEEDGTD